MLHEVDSMSTKLTFNQFWCFTFNQSENHKTSPAVCEKNLDYIFVI